MIGAWIAKSVVQRGENNIMEQEADNEILMAALQKSLPGKVTNMFSMQDTKKIKLQSGAFSKILNKMNPNLDSKIKWRIKEEK